MKRQMIEDKISLDTSGEYLQIGRHKPSAPKPEQDAEQVAMQKLFLDNAFLFLSHRERILTDNRMAQAAVPVQSGLAYTGTSGLRNPTLGVYLEFWMNSPQAALMDENEREYLVYRIAGSPLTGNNRCGIVYEDGTTKNVPLPCFRNLWSSLMEISRKYVAKKDVDFTYSLDVVVALLKYFYVPSSKDFFYKKMADYWNQRCKVLETTCEKLSRDLLLAKMNAVRQQLTVLVDGADRLQGEIDAMVEETKNARHEMLENLHAGLMTSAEYQRWWMTLPIRKKEVDAIAFRKKMIDDTLRNLFAEDCCLMSLDMVKEFLEEQL